jgi:hypothetical protein
MVEAHAEPASVVVEVPPVRVTMRSYLSSQHLWMARHCAEYATSYEARHDADRPAFHIHQRGYVLAAITESVAFTEALINEFFLDVHDSHGERYDSLSSKTSAFIASYWQIAGSGNNVALLTKYEMARLLGHGTRYDKGAEPYQSMKALIDLRNWQLHYRPKSVGGDDAYDIAKRLAGRFPDCRLMTGSGNAWFPDKALGAGCANWAVATATRFADDFVEALEVEPNYRVVQHPTEPPPLPGSS